MALKRTDYIHISAYVNEGVQKSQPIISCQFSSVHLDFNVQGILAATSSLIYTTLSHLGWMLSVPQDFCEFLTPGLLPHQYLTIPQITSPKLRAGDGEDHHVVGRAQDLESRLCHQFPSPLLSHGLSLLIRKMLSWTKMSLSPPSQLTLLGFPDAGQGVTCIYQSETHRVISGLPAAQGPATGSSY